MTLVGEYISPDGQLRFIVTCPDGDWTIGFDGFPWHTHGSILAELSGQNVISAVERFLGDLTTNVSVIALRRTAGKLTAVWVSDDPRKDLLDHERHHEVSETVEFRLWDGTPVTV
jgi:hypothetical protein